MVNCSNIEHIHVDKQQYGVSNDKMFSEVITFNCTNTHTLIVPYITAQHSYINDNVSVPFVEIKAL